MRLSERDGLTFEGKKEVKRCCVLFFTGTGVIFLHRPPLQESVQEMPSGRDKFTPCGAAKTVNMQTRESWRRDAASVAQSWLSCRETLLLLLLLGERGGAEREGGRKGERRRGADRERGREDGVERE